MKFEGFLHLNIRCSESDLPAIEKFYGEVLGLRKGYRPDFMFNGIWLYDGDEPIVHVGARFPKGSFVKDKHNGSMDHIAWKASGAVDFRKRLKKPRHRVRGAEHRERGIPGVPVRPGRHQARVQFRERARRGRSAARHDRGREHALDFDGAR